MKMPRFQDAHLGPDKGNEEEGVDEKRNRNNTINAQWAPCMVHFGAVPRHIDESLSIFSLH